MEKWIPPAVILLIVIIVAWPPILILFAAVLCFWFGVVGYYRTKTPPPYLSVNSDLDIVVNWFSKLGLKTAIRILENDQPARVIEPDSSVSNEYTGKYVINSVTVKNLAENQKYFYEIIDAAHPNRVDFGGNSCYFTKPSSDFKDGSLRVAVFGDLQPVGMTPPLIQWKIMKNIAREEPDMILFLGDHTNEGTRPGGWQIFYNLLGRFSPHTPMLGVPGNHDTVLNRSTGPRLIQEAYRTYVNYPDPKSRYFLTLYGMQIFAFDFSSGFSDDSKNMAILTDNIDQLRPDYWPVVMWHSSPHNSTRFNDNKKDIREKLIPLLDEKGCRLWLGGHEHSYQKYKVNETYYITAGATSSFHNHRHNSEHLEELIMQFHHVMLSVEKNTLKIKAISIKNEVLDEFEIRKK